MASQDWDRVVIRAKTGPSKKVAPGTGGVPTERKFAAGSNSKAGDTNMAKLANETDVFTHTIDKKSGLALGKAIQKARVEKKMTQAKLAQAINEKPAVINQYENGKAIPNGQLIAKIERVLGTKLPRPSKS